MKAIRFFCIGIVALVLLLLSVEKNFAAGPKYPVKPIQVIVGFPPGDTDVNLRPFIDKMSDYLGQPMTIIYKPGASGSVGGSFVVNSKPDGYTIFGTAQSTTVVVPVTQKGVGYTLDSFTPICNLVEAYSTMFVQGNARWKNLPELVAEAKKNPGQISYTSSGALAIQNLLAEAFAKEAGIKLNHIPSLGSGPAIIALLGGHVDMAVLALSAGLPHIQGGALRPIGIFNPKRVRVLPNYPTVMEQGYSVDPPTNMYGLMGPKGTPKEVVEALNSAARKVSEDHKAFLLERYDKIGSEILYLPSEEYGANLRRQLDFFSKIVKELTQ